jgi:DHA2 family multidrug resistance protein
VFWTNALQGFGFGLAFTPMTVLAFSTLPASQVTEASSVFTLVRNFGSSLYISLTITLLVRSTATNYSRMIELINPFNPTLKGPAAPAPWNIGTTSGLMRLANEIQRQASMIGYTNAFYLIALTAGVAAPLVWLMRNRPVQP